MKAVCWAGRHRIKVEGVPDPKIMNPHDAIVKVTSTAICSSDLHLFDGYIMTVEEGDIFGHEFMREIVDIGKDVSKVKLGDRVVLPFSITCEQCFFCKRGPFSPCDNTYPNALMAETVYGQTTGGYFGHSHLTGGHAGSQAEYVRVPSTNVDILKTEEGLADDQLLYHSDILSTGHQKEHYAKGQDLN